MKTSSLRPVLIMAGGTGGHIFPALAVAKALQAENCPVMWLGTPDSMEARIVPQNDIPLHMIKIGGVRGKSIKTKLLLPFKLLRAIVQACRIIKKEKPSAVIGFGGFVTGPGGLATWLSRVPLLIHEQNAIAGMTNRHLAKFARNIYTAFPNSFSGRDDVKLIGNPIRKEIAELHVNFDADRPNRKNILIVGGSLGAKVLNQLVPQAMSQLDEARRPNIKHQAGKRTIDIARKSYQDADVKAEIIEFIDDMATAYNWADIIICRAGALTVSEVTAVGLPAIFVPFPYAVDDHQRLNAESVAQNGGAIVVTEKNLNANKLASIISGLLSDQQALNTMRRKSHALGKLDAVDILSHECLKYATAGSMEIAA